VLEPEVDEQEQEQAAEQVEEEKQKIKVGELTYFEPKPYEFSGEPSNKSVLSLYADHIA
jgi:hypothetical protein